MRLEVVKRYDTAKGFVVRLKTWMAERLFGCLGSAYRL
jgi:hypothetical protein